MKNHITTLILILGFIAFTGFITALNRQKVVLSVDSPYKIQISTDNKKTNKPENICLDNIDVFSLEPTDDFYNKYTKSLNLSKTDIISLGYLAQEYAQKVLTNQKVSINYTPKLTPQCRYAQINISGINYSTMLINNGFGIVDGHILNKQKFEENLEKARKLNLVILNHHSGKFHTLDCPYGNIAHDTVLIPQKQLPANTVACKYCHNKNTVNNQSLKYKKDYDIFNIPKIPQPALTTIEGNIKLFFTDYTKNLLPNNRCETNVCKEFLHLINQSNKNIDLAIYGYDNIPAITSALNNAKARGVQIRFVYDSNFESNKDYYKDNKIIAKLATVAKSDVTNSKTTSNMLMHNKFAIFDNDTVFTGSMNFSKSGLSDFDVNDVIVINSKEVADLYISEFEQMIKGKFHSNKIKLNLNNQFQIGNSQLEVYFSPKDKQCTRIVQLINSSKKYIYIPTFLITHKDITNALIRAKQRGIDVKIIIDANSVSTRNTKHAILRQNNIPLKTENYAGKLHSKTMIIDDEYLITGSMNFSNSGENKNDENTLIIRNRKLATMHKEFFNYLWAIIPDKYLKQNARPESPDSIGSCSDGIDNNFNGKIDKEEEFCR